MLKNRGAALTLAALFTLAGYGVWLSSHEPPLDRTVSRPNQGASKHILPEAPDERIATYTEVLAWFTGLLALVSCVQIASLIRADNTARMAAEAARDGVKIARDEFNATHRPKLRVRRMNPHLIKGTPVSVQYVMVNVGETTAIIKRHEITLCIDSGAIETLQRTLLGCPQLKGGESRPFSTNIDAQFDYGWGIADDRSILKILGIVEYEDGAGTMRRTGFLRTYDAKLGRFRASDDNEEEYED